MIKLSSPISFPSNNKIAPVCLPESGNDFTGEDAIVTGWGTTKYGQFFTIKKISVCAINSSYNCHYKVNRIEVYSEFLITENETNSFVAIRFVLIFSIV